LPHVLHVREPMPAIGPTTLRLLTVGDFVFDLPVFTPGVFFVFGDIFVLLSSELLIGVQ
jgi:hypothetical protein